MRVLQLTVHLFPNVGGVETHLSDLFNALIKRGHQIFALAYQPLSTKTDWKIIEKKKNLIIFRIPWIRGFFEKLVKYPSLEFVYLVPGLLFITPFVILFYKPQVIHAHGLSAAVSAAFWGKVFRIRTVVSLHSIYSFPRQGLYRSFVKLLLSNCDTVLSLSNKSNEEIKVLSINKPTRVFTYWIDLDKFQKIPLAKNKLKWQKRFVILFVGRLIEEKGLKVLLQAASSWNKEINLFIIGSGLLRDYILQKAQKLKNVTFLGVIKQDDLPIYYSAADCLIVPSTSEEGFGRVIIESLACGTPVLAANKGAIPEAINQSVGKLFEATPESITGVVNYIYQHPVILKKMAVQSRSFAERRYSESNVEAIISSYSR